MSFFGQDCTRGTLVKVVARIARDLDPGPFALLKIESKHVLMQNAGLTDAPIHHHGLLEGDGGVALPRADTHAVREDDRDLPAGRIKLQHLVRALANVPLAVEREAAAKDVELVLVVDRGVRLAAFDLQLRLAEVIDLFPHDFLVLNLRDADLFDRL